jgi:hypothetical protein
MSYFIGKNEGYHRAVTGWQKDDEKRMTKNKTRRDNDKKQKPAVKTKTLVLTNRRVQKCLK